MLNIIKTYSIYTANFLIITFTLLLASCNTQPQSIEYYMEHKDEMHSKVKECQMKKATTDKECQNAFEAMHRTSLKIDNMPKIK